MSLRVLIVTSEWPDFDGDIVGIHVVHLIERLREHDVYVDVFAFKGRKNPWRYLLSCLRFLRSNYRDYDLINAQHGQAGIIALSQREVPVVVTFHGSEIDGLFNMQGRMTILGYVLQAASRWVARRAAANIVVSDHLGKKLGGLPYHVIPVGIDLDIFKPMPQNFAKELLGLCLEKRYALFVGHPARAEKRFSLAEQALVIARQKTPVELIVLDGRVPNELMPRYLNAVDLLLITSKSEGSPTVVKEALACGTPIVSVAVGDLPDRIGNVPGCILCMQDDPETIGMAISHVLSLKQRLNIENGNTEFDDRKLAAQVIDIYMNAFRSFA